MKFHPHQTLSPHPFPSTRLQPLASTHVLSDSMNLTFLGASYKWYPTVSVWTYYESESASCSACLTLCDPMDYTVHGILQARILQWVAFPFSRGSSQPRDWTQVSYTAGRFFTSWATRETTIVETTFGWILLELVAENILTQILFFWRWINNIISHIYLLLFSKCRLLLLSHFSCVWLCATP